MVERQTNWLGQMRIDVPILRAMESSVSGDFDVSAGQILSGRQALVVSGFKLSGISTGAPATSIQVLVAGSILVNYNASEAGSMFSVPSNRANETLSSTNPVVSGSWTASTTNFIGIDLLRSADTTTSDTLQFLNATTLAEVPKVVPLARTLNYRLVISTTSFGAQPNLVPIAKVVTDASNNIVSVTDCRNILGRVAPGGDFPNIYQGYTWPGGRAENLTGDVFSNGDKAIGSVREWMQAAMTRTWEIGGGEFWYSATADRGVTMVWTGATFTDGENFEWTGTNLHWKGLKFSFDNSTAIFNDVHDQTTDNPGQTDLADGQCIYVDLDRTTNRTGGTALVAVKANLSTLGPGSVPGSRWIIARRIGANIYTLNWRYAVGTTFVPATPTSLGVVKLSSAATTPSTPIVISDGGGTVSGDIGFNGGGVGCNFNGNWRIDTSVFSGLTFTAPTVYGSSVPQYIFGDDTITMQDNGSGGSILQLLCGGTTAAVGTTNATHLGFFVNNGLTKWQINHTTVDFEGLTGSGNIRILGTKDFVYETAVTRHYHCPALNMTLDGTGAPPWFLAFQGTGGIPTWQNNSTNAGADLGARLLAPAGATISAIKILAQNTDSIDRAITTYAFIDTYTGDTATYTATDIESGGSGVSVTITHGLGHMEWFTVPLAAGPFTVPDDGYVWVELVIPSTTSAGQMILGAVKLDYTQTLVKPMA